MWISWYVILFGHASTIFSYTGFLCAGPCDPGKTAGFFAELKIKLPVVLQQCVLDDSHKNR
jgi:hypothetical protein